MDESWLPEHLDREPQLVIVGNVCRRDNPEALEAEYTRFHACLFLKR